MTTTNLTNSTNEVIRKTTNEQTRQVVRSEGSGRRRNLVLLFHSCDSCDSWLPRSKDQTRPEVRSEGSGRRRNLVLLFHSCDSWLHAAVRGCAAEPFVFQPLFSLMRHFATLRNNAPGMAHTLISLNCMDFSRFAAPGHSVQCRIEMLHANEGARPSAEYRTPAKLGKRSPWINR